MRWVPVAGSGAIPTDDPAFPSPAIASLLPDSPVPSPAPARTGGPAAVSDRSGRFPSLSGREPAHSGRFQNPPGRWPAPSGRFPNLSGRRPKPSGSFPNRPGRRPDPSGCFPNRSGRWPAPSGCFPAASGCFPDPSGRRTKPSGRVTNRRFLPLFRGKPPFYTKFTVSQPKSAEFSRFGTSRQSNKQQHKPDNKRTKP